MGSEYRVFISALLCFTNFIPTNSPTASYISDRTNKRYETVNGFLNTYKHIQEFKEWIKFKKKKRIRSRVYRKLSPVSRHGILSSSLVSLLKYCPHFISFIVFRSLFFAQCTLRWLLNSSVQFLYICLPLLVFFVLAYWRHISDSNFQTGISHVVVTVTLLNVSQMYSLYVTFSSPCDRGV
jgi:hypothetical protein